MFKTSLDTCLYYITYRKDIAMKFQYLKPIFKNKRNSIAILVTIILKLKSLVHF